MTPTKTTFPFLSAICLGAAPCPAIDFFSEDLGQGISHLTISKDEIFPHLGAPINVDNHPCLCTSIEGPGYHQWAALPGGTPMTFIRQNNLDPASWVYHHFGNGNNMPASVRIRLLVLLALPQ